MGFDGGETGTIAFEDETGTIIESSGGLVLIAKEGIRLESMTGIAVQGMSDIMALHSEGKSSLCINGSVDMLGTATGMSGSACRSYAPFDDAPKEGEFDWGGFARNLVMGLAVGAACIALAVFLPGIGVAAAGALFGAGMGAISASIAGAVNDYSAGNVRSLKEAAKDMEISMRAGAFTGAVGAVFPAVNWLGEGLINAGSGIVTRTMYALTDDDMPWKKKAEYIFDWKQVGVDFATGVVMHFAFKGITRLITGKKTVAEGVSKTNFENEVPRSGEEWDAFLKEKYGSENVIWESKSGSGSKQIIQNRYPNELQAGKRFNYAIENGKVHIENGIHNVNFVIDMDGNLHLGQGHSFLANGMDVQAAGTLKVNSQGYVRAISNGSGHYTPTVEQGRMFPSLLNDLGIRTKNAWLELGDHSLTPSGYVDLTKSSTIIEQLK